MGDDALWLLRDRLPDSGSGPSRWSHAHPSWAPAHQLCVQEAGRATLRDSGRLFNFLLIFWNMSSISRRAYREQFLYVGSDET